MRSSGTAQIEAGMLEARAVHAVVGHIDLAAIGRDGGLGGGALHRFGVLRVAVPGEVDGVGDVPDTLVVTVEDRDGVAVHHVHGEDPAMLIGHDRLGGHAPTDRAHQAQAALVRGPVAAALAVGARGAVCLDVPVCGAGLECHLDSVMKHGQLAAQRVRHAAEATRGASDGCPECRPPGTPTPGPTWNRAPSSSGTRP